MAHQQPHGAPRGGLGAALRAFDEQQQVNVQQQGGYVPPQHQHQMASHHHQPQMPAQHWTSGYVPLRPMMSVTSAPIPMQGGPPLHQQPMQPPYAPEHQFDPTGTDRLHFHGAVQPVGSTSTGMLLVSPKIPVKRRRTADITDILATFSESGSSPNASDLAGISASPQTTATPNAHWFSPGTSPLGLTPPISQPMSIPVGARRHTHTSGSMGASTQQTFMPTYGPESFSPTPGSPTRVGGSMPIPIPGRPSQMPRRGEEVTEGVDECASILARMSTSPASPVIHQGVANTRSADSSPTHSHHSHNHNHSSSHHHTTHGSSSSSSSSTTSSSISASSAALETRSPESLIAPPPDHTRKRKRKPSARAVAAGVSPSSSPGEGATSNSTSKSRELREPRESRHTSVDADEQELSPKEAENVDRLLSSAGLSSSTVVNLINNKVDKYEVQRETGFSHNYIMALQRKVLRNSEGLQLRDPDLHTVGGVEIHVMFDDVNGLALFIRKELFTALSMSGTSFSYWRKRAGVSEIDTSMDFRLMDQCRTIFGGRATYTLYTAQGALAILTKMENSRLKTGFTNFENLRNIVARYSANFPLKEEKAKT
eukprot:TRINITY_DN2044_c0_g1_i1.p1 TRINITY_DN2044_c0_g1~~TRINITY_DN2044_c0_g1_i1.p1  ORF type:complete len:598 (-),score=112.26 TRINITY_DN2044_c0_g1_i1:263-2056(-)